MTDRGRETRAGKRKPTINRRRTKDAAIELPKRCEIFLRIVWPTEVKLKPPTKLDEVTKKRRRSPSGNLHHFDHNRYCSDDDSQQHHHHTEQKPHESGWLFLFGRRRWRAVRWVLSAVVAERGTPPLGRFGWEKRDTVCVLVRLVCGFAALADD